MCTDSRPYLSTRTTGTTGAPAEIWLSRYEAELWPAMAALSGLLRNEINHTDCLQINLSSRATAAVQHDIEVCRLVGARSRALGLVPVDQSIDGLLDHGDGNAATILGTYPSYLARLVTAARRRGLGPDDFALRRIDVAGEMLSHAVATAAHDTFGVRPSDTFAMTEVLPVSGRTCGQGHLHLDLNMGLVEVIALDGGGPCAPGELGTMVVTPFFPYRDCMPVFRYDTRDVVRRLPDEPLTCNLAGVPALSAILGKAGQLQHHLVRARHPPRHRRSPRSAPSRTVASPVPRRHRSRRPPAHHSVGHRRRHHHRRDRPPLRRPRHRLRHRPDRHRRAAAPRPRRPRRDHLHHRSHTSGSLTMSLIVRQSLLQLTVSIVATMAATLGAVAYLRRVRAERPAIGTFNFRDVATLFAFIITLPLIYLALPRFWLTTFLAFTFGSALAIGLRPVLRPTTLWVFIGTLLGANIWVARTMLGTQAGWQLYWVLVGTVVLISAISVANLYVQGGMQLRHAAWFTLLLAAYDFYFSQIVPLTPELADRFQGYPLNAAVGFRFDVFNAAIGIGDLLAFGIFGAATYKAYGTKALRLTLACILIFGAAAPSLTPLVLGAFTRGSLNIVVPVQTWFGPPAFLLYRWMRTHYGPERTMAEFRAHTNRPAPTPAGNRSRQTRHRPRNHLTRTPPTPGSPAQTQQPSCDRPELFLQPERENGEPAPNDTPEPRSAPARERRTAWMCRAGALELGRRFTASTAGCTAVVGSPAMTATRLLPVHSHHCCGAVTTPVLSDVERPGVGHA